MLEKLIALLNSLRQTGGYCDTDIYGKFRAPEQSCHVARQRKAKARECIQFRLYNLPLFFLETLYCTLLYYYLAPLLAVRYSL